MENILSFILYITVYLISAVLMTRSIKKNRKILFIIALTIPIIFASLRYYVGTDYENYHYTYISYSHIPIKEFFKNGLNNLGLFVIVKIANIIGGEKVYFGICALLIYLLFVLGIKKSYSKNSLFLLIFLFLMQPFTVGLNIIRQTIAVSISFVNFENIYSKNFKKFLLLLFLAISFHTTAIVTLPMYFLYSKNSRQSYSWKSILIVLISIILFSNIQYFFPMLSSLSFLGKYSSYLSSTTTVGSNTSLLLKLMIIAFILLFKKRLEQHDEKNAFLILLLVISLCLELTGFFSAFIKRLSMYYYSIPSILLLSQIPIIAKNSRNKLALYLGIITYAVLLFLISYVILKQSNIIPYRIN